MTPSVTATPGLISATVAIWPGADSSASRSVNCTCPLIPLTGPNAAAKSTLSVPKVPVEVTPSGLHAIRPLPRIVPRTSAMTPKVSRVSSSGWKPSPKVMPGTASCASPLPLGNAWRMATSATLTLFSGVNSVPCAVMMLSRSARETSRASNWLNRGSAAASATFSAPVSANAPLAKRQSPPAPDSSSGTLPIWPAPSAKVPASAVPLVTRPPSWPKFSRVTLSGRPIRAATCARVKPRSEWRQRTAPIDSASGEPPSAPARRTLFVAIPPRSLPPSIRSKAPSAGQSVRLAGRRRSPERLSDWKLAGTQLESTDRRVPEARTSSGRRSASTRPALPSGPVSVATVLSRQPPCGEKAKLAGESARLASPAA